MIAMSDKSREILSKYVGPDGKFIIDDSLPDDIKESFKFFNEEGVNIMDSAGADVMGASNVNTESVNVDTNSLSRDDVSSIEQLAPREGIDSSTNSGSDLVKNTEPSNAVRKELADKDLEDLDNLF